MLTVDRLLETFLITDDVDRARRFYGDFLGLEPHGGASERGSLFRLPGGQLLGLITREAARVGNRTPGGRVPPVIDDGEASKAGREAHLAFAVSDDELAAWRSRCRRPRSYVPGERVPDHGGVEDGAEPARPDPERYLPQAAEPVNRRQGVNADRDVLRLQCGVLHVFPGSAVRRNAPVRGRRPVSTVQSRRSHELRHAPNSCRLRHGEHRHDQGYQGDGPAARGRQESGRGDEQGHAADDPEGVRDAGGHRAAGIRTVRPRQLHQRGREEQEPDAENSQRPGAVLEAEPLGQPRVAQSGEVRRHLWGIFPAR